MFRVIEEKKTAGKIFIVFWEFRVVRAGGMAS